jgi:hypothetical protein
MTTTPMWHPTRATDRPVYHDDTLCPEGSAIDLAYRRPGDGGCASCEHCMELLVQTIEAIWARGGSTVRPPGGDRGPGERPTSAGPTAP